MKKLILFLIISFFISGCEYFSIMSKKEWEEKVDKKDDVIIYIAGWYNDGSIKPCYWKIKGDHQELIKLESSNVESQANSIYVVGDNVYTCGYDTTISTGNRQPCYWINKKIKYLNVEMPLLFNSLASSIKVKNEVIFTSGTADGKACFWINQDKMELNILRAYTIFIEQVSSSKHTIYIGGQDLKIPPQACFWKDGQIHDLQPLVSGADTSEVWSIYVIGNIVYSAGRKNISGIKEACLWKNHDLRVLPGGSIAYSVFVSNEDVYCAGVDNTETRSCYWKNNNIKLLPYNGVSSVASSIYVFNDNTYIAGYDTNIMGITMACYWKNNKQIILNSPGSSQAWWGIFVTSDNEE